MTKLSGDLAYELFVCAKPFPLHNLLDDWKEGKVKGAPGYILAVIRAFDRMTANCQDGRYQGVLRTAR